MMMFIFPIAVAGLAVVWALPETGTAPEKTLTILFFAFAAALGLWPNYLALTLPGLPWITVARLTGYPLALVFLISISVSAHFRRRLVSAVEGTPVIWKLVLSFAAIQFVSIIFSKDKGPSLDRFVTAQVAWTMITFISAFIVSRPNFATRWATLMWLTLIPIGLLGVWENHLHHVPWLGHIPRFLTIEDPQVTAVLYGSTRADSGIYRVQSTFTTSITLAEYIALILPFVIYNMLCAARLRIRLAAFLTLIFTAYVILLTNSRSGVIGLIISVMLSLLYWGAMKWRHNKTSIIGPAIVFSYPITGAAVLAATFFVGRLHRLVWGGGAYANSTAARGTQLQMGLPKVFHHPWGYGIGEGAKTLGFYVQSGFLTIDNYYLDIALEYGIIGFLLFYGLLIYTIYKGAWFAYFDDRRDPETALLAPASIALFNFLIIKSVFSEQDNNPIVFMLIGIVMALVTRVSRAQAAAPLLRAAPAERERRPVRVSKPIAI
jgi:hypothetical protein